MPCIHIPGGYLLTVGGPEIVINVYGKDIRFEHHEYCGPSPIGKRGNFITLGPRHKFWHAVTCWAKQGYRVENGRAIWQEPPTTRFVKIDKRNMIMEEMAKRMGITGEIVEIPDY